MSALPTPIVALPVVAAPPTATDPLGRIVRAYDRAIHACESFNKAAANEAIGVLRGALDLGSPAARSFDALYAWCERAVENHDFIGPAQTLRALRAAWCRVASPPRISPRPEWPVS